MVQFYNALPQSEVSQRVVKILTELQTIIMAFKLPTSSPKHNIQLKQWQKDISSDPKKVTE